ncbi:hypothetical protein GCM10027578_27090 [Spirosoma luteolum]
MRYRHYSFDVWLTLIRSNPAFRQARTVWFADHFNPHGLSLADVDERVKEVDVTCTRINELVGRNIYSLELCLLMAHRLGADLRHITPERVARIEGELAELFRAYPPHLTDEQLLHVLETLRQSGATLSVLSNTGIILGTHLRAFFHSVGIGRLFQFQLYSDEVTLSKPNPAFYALICQEAQQLPIYRSNRLQPATILHVGDNPVADVAGATNAGLSALLINPNQPNFTQLLHD